MFCSFYGERVYVTEHLVTLDRAADGQNILQSEVRSADRLHVRLLREQKSHGKGMLKQKPS